MIPKEVIEPGARVGDLAPVAAFEEVSQKDSLNRFAGKVLISGEAGGIPGELGSVLPMQTHQLLLELLLQQRSLRAGRGVRAHWSRW